MPENGCGIWNERANPLRQRRSAGNRVMSSPANSTRPESGGTVPAAMPNKGVLPAPFGPMMPSASPSRSARSTPSATTTAPNRLDTFSSARTGAMVTSLCCHARTWPRIPIRKAKRLPKRDGRDKPGYGACESGKRLQFASERNIRCGLVFGYDQIELAVLSLPLSCNERSLGDVFHRRSGPLNWTDDRLVIGRHDRFQNGLRIPQILRALEDVDRNLKQCVLETDRLGPRPVRCPGIGIGKLSTTLPREARFERVVWRPPDLAGQPIAARAKRLDDRGEKQGFADGDNLRLESLLRGLRPECREIRWDHVAGDDLGPRRLESGNLRREVVIHELIAAGIVQLVAGLRERRRQAELRIAPGISVRVVREESADDLVGRQIVPQRQKRCDHVLKPPEEMIGPGKSLFRISLAAEEIGLPRTICGDARHLVHLGLIRHGICRVGRG